MPFTSLPIFFAQNPEAEVAVAGIMLVMMICWMLWMAFILGTVIATVVGMWKIFEKAGKPGWAAIVPIYNMIVLHELSGLEVMWLIFCFLPILNIVGVIMIWIEVAKNFGKDAGYGVLLALLPFIFVPMLGFGNAQWQPYKRPPPIKF